MNAKPMPQGIPAYGPPISLETAKRVMAAAEAEAEKMGWPMVIAIVDSSGLLVMLTRHDQAQHGSVIIAQEKARTAANFRRPTKAFQDGVAGGGAGLRILSMPNALPMEGGVPILADGKVIGAIGVSGMQSHEDAQVALAGIAAL